MDWNIERLERLAELRDMGALSEDEFISEKAKLLKSDDPTLGPEGKKQAASKVPSANHNGIGSLNGADPPGETHKPEEAQAGPGSPQTTAPDIDNREGGGTNQSAWRAWLKWPSMAVMILGIFVILAKFGTALAILTALSGICVHLYASARNEPNAKLLAYVAYGSAIAIYLAGSLAKPIIPRPSQGELTEAQFSTDCQSKRDFEANCLGKFVIWDGVLERDGISLDDGAFRIDLGNRTIDLYGADLDDDAYFDGMKVRFSGYISKQNSAFDDVDDGEIVGILNNPVDVKNEKIASGELPSAEECAAERQKIYTFGQIEAMCHRITAGAAGASIAASVCLSDKIHRLQACGIKIHQSPF